MREVAAEFERPVLLFSGGKDSIVLLRLAEKAFCPAPFPFPVMHIDTGHNFPEALDFRDRRVARAGRAADRRVGAGLDRRRAGGRGAAASRNRLQTVTLLDAIARAPLRRRLRWRAPRRGARPRQGARVLASATTTASGSRERSARSCGGSTTAPCGRASMRACSRSRTGPSSTSGTTSPPRTSSCRRSTTRMSATCSSATACSTPSRSS